MSDMRTNIIDLDYKYTKRKKKRPGKPFFSKSIGPLINLDTANNIILWKN